MPSAFGDAFRPGWANWESRQAGEAHALGSVEDQLFHFSLRSRCTAMPAGSRTLIHTGHSPDR